MFGVSISIFIGIDFQTELNSSAVNGSRSR